MCQKNKDKLSMEIDGPLYQNAVLIWPSFLA